MKVRLSDWLKSQFEPAPAIRTALRWVKDRKIYPQPVKIGRTYYVEQNAIYQDGTQRPRLAQRIPH